MMVVADLLVLIDVKMRRGTMKTTSNIMMMILVKNKGMNCFDHVGNNDSIFSVVHDSGVVVLVDDRSRIMQNVLSSTTYHDTR